MPRIIQIPFLLAMLLCSQLGSAQKLEHYRLDKPDKRYELPDKLQEISGLSHMGSKRLLAIQDEKGNLYRVDLKDGDVDKLGDFAKSGDYEGVLALGDSAWVLRSDGELFAIQCCLKGDEWTIDRFSSPQEGWDAEGLAYDPATQLIYVAIKNVVKDDEGHRYIMRFDPARGEYLSRPIKVNMESIRKAFDKDDANDKFHPSALAVHPISGHIYVLASSGNKLAVIDQQGKLKDSQSLAANRFRQPEGICFDKDGDMYIASEGRKKEAYILRFEYKD
jgi:uncharacterized protein YjiK